MQSIKGNITFSWTALMVFAQRQQGTSTTNSAAASVSSKSRNLLKKKIVEISRWLVSIQGSINLLHTFWEHIKASNKQSLFKRYGAWMTTFSTNPYFIFPNVLSVILHSLSRNCFLIKNQILLLFQKVL